MAIFIDTSEPTTLLSDIKTAIRDNDIRTWEVDSDGDFTYIAEQWRCIAWFRPHIESDRLVFGIIGRKEHNLKTVEYSIYHSRFVEMILTHFDCKCDNIKISPLATEYDSVTAFEKNI